MAEIKGTNVASKIVPYTDSDEYATHDEKYGVGGYRTVDSVSEMNAIPAARRKEGMLVYVKNDKYYRLNSSNTFVDAGIGSSGGGDIYIIDTDKLNFELISDGKAATNNELVEVMAILERWGSSVIPIYIQSSVDRKAYVGVLNFSIVDGSDVVFSIPYNDTITLYSLNLSTTNWSVLDLSAGGGGSGNVKVLTTSGLFSTSRNKSVTLNSNDAAIINSLANNNYKNVQLYYVGDPAGDNGIYPVNIASNSLSSSLSLGDVIYLSILADNGNIKSEALDYNSSTDISTKGNNADDKNWTSGYNLSQNGYQKFSNGLMLQWGYTQGAGSGNGKTVYMPTSFINSTYNVQSAGILQNTNEKIVYSPSVYTKGTSYFTIYTRYIGQGSTNVETTGWNFEWIAIGRWK